MNGYQFFKYQEVSKTHPEQNYCQILNDYCDKDQTQAQTCSSDWHSYQVVNPKKKKMGMETISCTRFETMMNGRCKFDRTKLELCDAPAQQTTPKQEKPKIDSGGSV